VSSFYEATTASYKTFPRPKVNFELFFSRHFVLGFSKCHVIKISKIFGDFVPRDSAFSGRSAILKIVEELALGTKLAIARNGGLP